MAILPATHVAAKMAVDLALPNLTPAQRLFLRAVAAHETQYGKGWTGDGADSHNWGAITGNGPAGFFNHQDSRRTSAGTIENYITKFQKYHSDAEGILALANQVFKPGTALAVVSSGLLGGATAMYGHGYYTTVAPPGAPAVLNYLTGLKARVKQILAATQEPSTLPDLQQNATESQVRDEWARLTAPLGISRPIAWKGFTINASGATSPVQTPVKPPVPSKAYALVELDPGNLDTALSDLKHALKIGGTPYTVQHSGAWQPWKLG